MLRNKVNTSLDLFKRCRKVDKVLIPGRRRGGGVMQSSFSS
jgi:hypothetical protein